MANVFSRQVDRTQGRPQSPAWEWFTVVVPKGVLKQHPDVTCNYCGKRIKNAMVSRNLLPHLTSGCRSAPSSIMESASDLMLEAMEKKGH
jgi:hypothetical protein